MGTPVIDPGKTTLYVVAKTLNNTVRNFSLHALDIRTGSELLGGPMVITGTAPSSNGSGTFNPIYQMQRPALLLQNGTVYIAFGGNGCDQYAYNGWFFAYNAQNLHQTAAFLVTPDGQRGSIWQGGSGPAVDEFGYIYVAIANGTYDGPAGGNDYGDSVLKMGWNGSVFGVVDYFTPYNQKQLAQLDLDLGSSGPLVLPDQPGLYPHEVVAGGKEGTLYLINGDNEGQFNPDTDDVIQSDSPCGSQRNRGRSVLLEQQLVRWRRPGLSQAVRLGQRTPDDFTGFADVSDLRRRRSSFHFDYRERKQQRNSVGDPAHQPRTIRLRCHQPGHRVLRQHASVTHARQNASRHPLRDADHLQWQGLYRRHDGSAKCMDCLPALNNGHGQQPDGRGENRSSSTAHCGCAPMLTFRSPWQASLSPAKMVA